MTEVHRSLGYFGVVLSAAAVVAACGSTGGPILAVEGSDGGGGDDDATTGAHPDVDGGNAFRGGDGGPALGCASGGTACSVDLHQVLDCAGNVIATCPADQGCDPSGHCVAACDSAKANRTSIGCEYYAIDPDGESNVPDAPQFLSAAGSCYVVFVANTWTTPVSVNVELGGQTIDVSRALYTATPGGAAAPTYTPLSGGSIPADQVGMLFLAQSTPGDGTTGGPSNPCPAGVNVAYTTSDPAIHGTGKGHAFHITTSAPVVAFDIWPYGGAAVGGGGQVRVPSATLLLPTSVWDKNYVAVTAYQPEQQQAGGCPGTPCNFDGNITFVASQPHTTITINPTADIAGGTGVPKAPKNAPAKYVLDEGESIQFEQFADLSGSAVLADKPIGAWGGHWGMYVPDGAFNVDSAHQQIPPVSALGDEYVAVRYRSRTASEESVPWRIMGAVDGTALTYEPSAPPGAPTTLKNGQLAEFSSAAPFVVKSQDKDHPFYFAGHMTGLGSIALGDPETVNVVPPQQYLPRYVFFTDPTYKETNLVVVRAKGGPSVSLDCMPAPLAGWQPIGARYEYTRVDVQTGGAKVGGCDNGRHTMTSAAPFGVTVWGFDTGVSYAYPAGAGVNPINTVVVSPEVPR